MFPKFIICGIEHSGTTLLSDLFRQTPEYDSGFEVGVLLAKNPREFRTLEPFISNLCKGWGIGEQDLDEICDADNLETFYERLWVRSSILDKTTRKPKLFDKTPRYLANLQEVADRARCPIFVCYKDPRSIVASDFGRAKVTDFNAWYASYLPKKRAYMRTLYQNYELAINGVIENCLPVGLENVCLDTRRTFDSVFSFVGEKFHLSYLNFQDLRYQHTKAPYVASNVPFQYFLRLTRQQQDRVATDFEFCRDWIYS